MKATRLPRLLASCCAAFLLLAAVASADNWPQWRGPTDDGICKEKNLPAEWSDAKNVVWKLKMPGMGGSTPAVWGDRMFLTSADGADMVLLCVSTAGKELWKKTLSTGGADKKFMGGEANNASASPCTDGKHVWATVGTGDFACFDFDGKEVWRFNAQDRYGKFGNMHGVHMTPLLHGDRLYVAFLHRNGQWVAALNKMTGEEVWKVERQTDGRGEGREAYASPFLWSDGKDEYLVVHGSDYTTAHSLQDGSEIWRLGDLNPKSSYRADLRLVASPAISPEVIVVPTAKNGPVVAVKPGAKGAIFAGGTGEMWRLPKGTTDVPTPLISDGLVYMCRENGTLVLLEAKTGKELYQERLHSGIYRASPVLADGKLYLTCRDGTFTVVKAGPMFEKVAENKLPDLFTASPAVSERRIYLRGWDTLYAIGEK